MNTVKKLIIIAFSSICFFSCYNNAFNDVLFRTTADPFYDTPEADSLTTEHTIYLSWKEDAAADRFYLMRSYDTVPLDFSCVYEGTATNYTDVNLANNEKYIYLTLLAFN